MANDSDVDGPGQRAVLVTGPQNGTLDLASDGALTYSPNNGFIGEDSFSYRFDDGISQSAVTTVDLSVSTRPVLISEINAANANGLTTKIRASAEDSFPRDEMTPDWIELQNLVSAPLDIGGMHLTDDTDDATKWSFPEGTTIPPNGYLVVFASSENIRDTALDENGFFHTNFSLGADGDYLAITTSEGSVVHEFAPGYPVQTADVSYGLIDDQPLYFSDPTPGAV